MRWGFWRYTDEVREGKEYHPPPFHPSIPPSPPPGRKHALRPRPMVVATGYQSLATGGFPRFRGFGPSHTRDRAPLPMDRSAKPRVGAWLRVCMCPAWPGLLLCPHLHTM